MLRMATKKPIIYYRIKMYMEIINTQCSTEGYTNREVF